MISPPTKILVKIFALGFYKAHSGLLLFLFIGFGIYFFFVEVLNQTHLPPDQIIYHNLILVLTLASSPFMMACMAVAWLFFIAKVYNYVSKQLYIPANQFLFYSFTSWKIIKQWESWFSIMLMISSPMLGYGLFSLIAGYLQNDWMFSILISGYTILLAAIVAVLIVYYQNKTITSGFTSRIYWITKPVAKRFPTLFLLQIFYHEKIALLVTKFISLAILIGGAYLFESLNDTLRTTSIVILAVALAHSFLLYQSFVFERTKVSFVRNFPYSKLKIYVSWLIVYSFLTLPEIVYLVLNLPLEISTIILLLHFSLAMFFKNVLYKVNPGLKSFVSVLFYSFLGCFVLILMNQILILVIFTVMASVFLLHKHYFKKDVL